MISGKGGVVRYEMLGPLQVVENGNVSFMKAPKAEQLLATLLIRFNQVVTIDQLIAELWGEQVPKRALAGLYVYVSQLRKFLSTAGHKGNPIVTHSSGYLLQLGSDELDFYNFQKLVDSGRGHVKEQRYEHAVTVFESALSLWRGNILSVLGNGPIGYGFVAWITEVRLECIEMLMECHLRLGHHREVIARLYSLTAEHPVREVFYCQLMLALYRSDRQADALSVYRQARRTLQSELGLEPCRALQDIQRAILTADEQLDVPVTTAR
jgi:SARP family transcriptional regulator, regulator of embCAB operon